MIDKVQAYPTPKIMKKVYAFVRILGVERLLFPIWHSICPWYYLEKKGHMWEWESEHQATFEKTEILV